MREPASGGGRATDEQREQARRHVRDVLVGTHLSLGTDVLDSITDAASDFWLASPQVEREFLDASIAVWREVDRLENGGPYPGIPPETDLRVRERRAWERYRDLLDSDDPEVPRG